jgi:hypothetical protein
VTFLTNAPCTQSSLLNTVVSRTGSPGAFDVLETNEVPRVSRALPLSFRRVGQASLLTLCAVLDPLDVKENQFRYALWRAWEGGAGSVLFVMLNPSDSIVDWVL